MLSAWPVFEAVSHLPEAAVTMYTVGALISPHATENQGFLRSMGGKIDTMRTSRCLVLLSFAALACAVTPAAAAAQAVLAR